MIPSKLFNMSLLALLLLPPTPMSKQGGICGRPSDNIHPSYHVKGITITDFGNGLKLGWHQFCLGRISIKWRSTYESLYDPKNHLKPLTWVSHLVLAIWTLTQKIWKCWNRIVHDIKLTSQMSQHMSQSHAKVTYMYQNFLNDPFQIPQHLRYLFDRPLSLLLGMSEDATKCWIVTVNEAIRTKSLIHHANAYSRKFMARFLGKENTPPPSQSHKPTKDRIQIQYQSDQTKH